MGHAGRGPFATGNDYTYFLFFKFADLVYPYMQINNPGKCCNDKDYRELQYKELLAVAQLLGNGITCHKELVEIALGNPLGDRTPSPPCGKCTVCNCENKLWPPVCKEGVCLVLFDIFTQPRLVEESYTVNNVASGIRKYQNISYHFFSIRSDKVPSLGAVNKVLFMMTAGEMINLEYEPGDNLCMILSLGKVSALNTT